MTRWTYTLDALPDLPEPDLRALVGGKAANLGMMLGPDLRLPVPPGFVITTEACRAFLAGGWPNGAGNWEPKPECFPRGFGPVGEAAQAAGLDFLVWFELERVSRGSRLAREHPEFLPAVSIHPARPDALQELERCIAEGAVITALGIATGLACGFGLQRLAGSYFDSIQMPETRVAVWVAAAAAGILLAAAAIASAWPAVRAARVDVIQALRAD